MCNKEGLLRPAFLSDCTGQYSESLQEFVDRQIAEGLEYLPVMSDS